MKQTKTVLYLGSKGFPYGMAAIQRQIQIAKAIRDGQTEVLVINWKGAHSQEIIEQEGIAVSGSFEGINYAYASGTARYPTNFVVRNFLKIVGFVSEFFIILNQRLTKNVLCAVVSTSSLTKLKYYWYVTRLFKIKMVYDYVEYMSSLDDRSLKSATTDKTFDTVFFKYADGLLIISSFLERHVNQLRSKLPYIIIPPIIDFDKFERIDGKPAETNYFLFCGSLQYIDVIEFIVDAYRKTNARQHGVSLILILNGDAKIFSTLRASITEPEIKVMSGLPYESLIGYYKNARALLIPLQDNLQDQARFPFKVSEYTAAGRPIVTSDSGAVVDYFQDGVNALLAKTGDVNDFSAKLSFILNNPEKAEQIGAQGHTLGQQYFNYKGYSKILLEFLSKPTQ